MVLYRSHESWGYAELEQVAQRWSLTWVQCAKVKSHFKKFKLIQALMLVLVTWKYQKDPIKNNREKSGNTIFPIIRSIGVFFRRSRAANSVVGGPIWPKFELINDIMYVLVNSKFEKDRININRDYVMTFIF